MSSGKIKLDEKTLYDLLQWAVGNRGSKAGNPYCVPEIVAVLKAIATHRGFRNVEHGFYDALEGWQGPSQWFKDWQKISGTE